MLLLLAVLLPLCACGAEKSEPVVEEYPLTAEGTQMGYIPQEVPVPEGWGDIRDITLCGNRIYVTGIAQIGREERMNGPAVIKPWLGVYQIAESRWQKIPLPEEVTGGFRSISAKDGVLWGLLVDYSEWDTSFAVVQYSETSGNIAFCSLSFSAAEGQNGFGFRGIVALSCDQAILYDEKNSYVIGSDGNCLKTIPNTEGDLDCRMERGDQIFARCTRDGQDGFSRFDRDTLSFTDFVPFDAGTAEISEFVSAGEVRGSRCESERDRLLLCGNDGLYCFERTSGSAESISPWTDLALRTNDLIMPKTAVLEDDMLPL